MTLAPRILVALPASLQPLVRAPPPLGAAAESRKRDDEQRQPATLGVGHLFTLGKHSGNPLAERPFVLLL